MSEEEREKEAESLFEEIMAENFPNLGKETDYLEINPGIPESSKKEESKETL